MNNEKLEMLKKLEDNMNFTQSVNGMIENEKTNLVNFLIIQAKGQG
jgi:hypothetical protein